MTNPATSRWQRIRHHSGYPVVLLASVSAICAAALGLTAELTGPAIAQAERADRLVAIAAVMPADRYDGDPLAHCQPWPQLAGASRCSLSHNGQPSGYLVSTASKGYGGPIQLLIGIDGEGQVTGVRVTAHTETPGLGDQIERAKSSWIDSFAGRSLANTSSRQWQVRKDGGDFDQFTGATITPRAVVAGVHDTLTALAASPSEEPTP